MNEFNRAPVFTVPILGKEWGENTHQPASTDSREPVPECLTERESIEQILDARKCVRDLCTSAQL